MLQTIADRAFDQGWRPVISPIFRIEPVAWAADGIVEALELDGDAWVLGVQWELQESWKEDERQAGIFRAFVSATARPAARAAAA